MKFKPGLTSQFSRFLGVLFLYLLFIISLMPIIAWWAGLAGLALAAVFIARDAIQKGAASYWTPRDILSRITAFGREKTGKLVLYTIFFGIIIHGACRIHSEVLVSNLYKQAKSEKNIILGNQ